MLTPGTQQPQPFQRVQTEILNRDYLLYLPVDYEKLPQQQWPFILFLHGAGERGDDLALVQSQGLPKLLRQRQDFPFLVVSPQCAKGARWETDSLNAVLDEVIGTYRIDVDRVYLTGLSMGGFGTWALAIASPTRFAAIAPICGGGDPRAVCTIQRVPVWAFHGAQDPVVPLERSREMIEALQQCGGDVHLTVYPEAGHDSWTQAYHDPHVYEWFLQHRRLPAQQAGQR